MQARLAQIDLFWDNGGVREASVLRYKEKRRTRLFSKKIRYEVRKVNADRRPRMKVNMLKLSVQYIDWNAIKLVFYFLTFIIVCDVAGTIC